VNWVADFFNQAVRTNRRSGSNANWPATATRMRQVTVQTQIYKIGRIDSKHRCEAVQFVTLQAPTVTQPLAKSAVRCESVALNTLISNFKQISEFRFQLELTFDFASKMFGPLTFSFAVVLVASLWTVIAQPLSTSQHNALMDVYIGLGSFLLHHNPV
jgi:hypothetical protein